MTLFKRALKKSGKEITIEDRVEKPVNGNATLVFSNPRKVKARVKTVSGVRVFDRTNTERDITHEMRIDYIDGITSENWVTLKGKRLEVITVENCCENDDVLILLCTERGIDINVNRA